jgi:hypothetical protein
MLQSYAREQSVDALGAVPLSGATRVQCAALAYALATVWRLEECRWAEAVHRVFQKWLDETWSKKPIGFRLNTTAGGSVSEVAAQEEQEGTDDKAARMHNAPPLVGPCTRIEVVHPVSGDHIPVEAELNGTLKDALLSVWQWDDLCVLPVANGLSHSVSAPSYS